MDFGHYSLFGNKLFLMITEIFLFISIREPNESNEPNNNFNIMDVQQILNLRDIPVYTAIKSFATKILEQK